ncbi:MAG: methyltransferase domain-containing protein [Actinomycetota bacterium]
MPWQIPPSRQPELMDDPALAAADHLHALDALAVINAVSGTAWQLAHAVERLLAARVVPTDRPAEIVDIGCGGGDVTVAVARRLASTRPVRVIGVDNSPRALERARDLAARAGVDVSFSVRDVIADGCPPCDIAVSSLVLHHFDDAPAATLLRSLAVAARRGVVISDLLRSRVGLALAVLGTTVLSSSRVARVDGPLSVKAARTIAEYTRLCAEAGMGEAVIRRIWPERVLVTWACDARDERVSSLKATTGAEPST